MYHCHKIKEKVHDLVERGGILSGERDHRRIDIPARQAREIRPLILVTQKKQPRQVMEPSRRRDVIRLVNSLGFQPVGMQMDEPISDTIRKASSPCSGSA